MTISIELVQNIREQYSYKDIVDIITEGFASKFEQINLGEETVKKIIDNFCLILWQESNLLVAIKDGKICGILVFATQESKTPFKKEIFKNLNIKESLLVLIILGLLSYTPKKNETYIEMLAVSKNSRRQGISSQLMNYMKARNWNKYLTLHVAEGNDGAIKLYKKEAFKIKKTRNSMLGKMMTGIYSFYFMRFDAERA